METWKLLDGETEVRDEGTAVWFRVRCKPPCEASRLLRCYGEAEPKDLLIGVLEPQNGRLTLERRISRESLRQSGIHELPTRFYLSDGGARESPAPTPPEEKPAAGTASEKNAEPFAPVPQTNPAAETSPQPDMAAKSPPPMPKSKPESSSPEPSQSCKHAAPSAAHTAKSSVPPASRRHSAPPPPVKTQKKAAIPKTGDTLLDAVIARGEAHCVPTPNGLRITCPFSPKRPFALAFIASLCRIEHRVAILDWKAP